MQNERFTNGALQSCLLAFLFITATTNSLASDDIGVWNSLKDGKVVALMRHAIAPGNGDPSEFVLGDCNTQRNLSSQGLQQAQGIGAHMKAYGITAADIYSSQWCRCIDTATALGVGAPQALPMLNSFYQDRSTAQLQTEQLRIWIRNWFKKQLNTNNPDDVAVVLVTHQVNITELTGVFPTSGELVFVAMGDDELEVVTSVVIAY